MQTFTGIEYLKIDIANNFGLDKLNWDERIKWFDENEQKLDSLIKQAEEPALFFSGLQAYAAYKAGKPSAYPISLDATSSGIQILAALTGDRQAAQLCNVIDTHKREDAYKGIYDKMVAKIGDSAKIDHKETKKAIMTSFYGSTAQPKNVFGEGKLLDVFYETLREEAPGAWELNEAMLAFWDPTVLSHDWIMPDNFHVHIKIMQTVTEPVHFLNKPYDVSYTINAPIEQGRSLGANMTHSIDGMIVREMTRRCSYDQAHVGYLFNILSSSANGVHDKRPKDKMVQQLWRYYQESGFLSVRILDYLDDRNIGHIDKLVIFDLIASLPRKPFTVIAIHDCFRCLPNYGNDLRRQYNRILSDIAKSEMLSWLLTQIVKRPINAGKLDKTLWKDILDADYALS